MNQKIRDYVATQKEPNFFSNNGDEELAIVHTEIQRGIETATDVMTFEIDLDVMLRAQAFLATIGWTLEEACILYLYWFIECPKEAIAWDKAYQIQNGDECENSEHYHVVYRFRSFCPVYDIPNVRRRKGKKRGRDDWNPHGNGNSLYHCIHYHYDYWI